jgi:hypothetical protein
MPRPPCRDSRRCGEAWAPKILTHWQWQSARASTSFFFSWTVAGSANAVATGARRRGGGVRRVSAHEGQLQVAPLPASHVARHAATASCSARDHGPSRGTPREPHARTLHSPSIRSDRPSERGEHPRATQATTSSIHRCPSPSRTPPAAST